jgi:AcrR family transcriptional regulator
VAGARAFAHLGYHGVKIAAVARDAGVANGTFYLHFRDKGALLRAVRALALEELAARLRAVESAERDPLESERRELEVIVDFAAEHADLLRAGLAQGAGAEAPRTLVAQRARALARGIAEGTVRADLDPEIAALADFGMLTFVLPWWLDRHDRVSRETLVRTLSALRRGGLGLRGAPGGAA